MHAILASLGTDGDVLPFIGVGVALRARGHRVTIVAAENYADLVASHWLEFRQLISTERMRALFGNPDVWHPLKAAQISAKWGGPLIEPQFQTLKSLAAENDSLLINNPAVFAAALVHETMGRPLATIVLQPWLIYSAIEPPAMPIVGLPRWAPRFMHKLFLEAVNLVGDVFIGRALNRTRRSLGLKPARRILSNWFSKQLVLGMFPEWYGAPQSDWPANTKLVGFPRFDAALNRSLPPGLHEFLNNPKPTIAFTFGSGMMHGTALFEAVTRVCARLNVQGIFINRFQTPAAPPHIFHATFIPFSEIFPRCAAVVHHGGIGTTAECFAAGAPQLILPLGFDQLDNGIRVQKLGAGLHTRSQHNLVARTKALHERDIDEICEALSRLLQPSFKAGARAIGERVRAQNGLEGAADAIEALFARA
jgi:rhamnosyltransferase subunit B